MGAASVARRYGGAAALRPMVEPEPQPGWFAILTKPTAELMVHNGLTRAGYTTFWPHHRLEVVRKKPLKADEEPAHRKRPYYPGYVFLHMEPFVPFWPVREAPGVSTVVFDHRGPYRLPDREIQRLQGLCDDRGALLPAEMPKILPGRERFNRGAPVRIVEGPMIGFEGEVVKDNGRKIWVMIKPRAWWQAEWKSEFPETAVKMLTEG